MDNKQLRFNLENTKEKIVVKEEQYQDEFNKEKYLKQLKWEFGEEVKK